MVVVTVDEVELRTVVVVLLVVELLTGAPSL